MKLFLQDAQGRLRDPDKVKDADASHKKKKKKKSKTKTKELDPTQHPLPEVPPEDEAPNPPTPESDTLRDSNKPPNPVQEPFPDMPHEDEAPIPPEMQLPRPIFDQIEDPDNPPSHPPLFHPCREVIVKLQRRNLKKTRR